jgi:hypothetical protein
VLSNRDPESMTSDERRREVASIMAQGLVRRVRASRSGDSAAGEESAEDVQNPLDLPVKTRLSVAPWPAG